MKKGMRFYGTENFGDGVLCVRMKKVVGPDGKSTLSV
jgi:hypothetical protein